MRKILATVLLAAFVFSMLPLLASGVATAETPPLPKITGVDPAEPIMQPSRQWLGIIGTGFDADSQVILSIEESVHPIPHDRTEFESSTRINVFVGLTNHGTWTAQVVNPGDVSSNIFAFTVITVDVRPSFQLPFTCGETWYYYTHAGHVSYELDMNAKAPFTDQDTGHNRPVLASASGTVTTAAQTGWNGGYGTWVEISHGSGWTTRYAHLVENSIPVSVGQHVRMGQEIGRLGTTGQSEGPHLHYEQRHNGVLQPVEFNGQAVDYSVVFPNKMAITSANCRGQLLTPPSIIRVLRVETGQIEEVDFKYYVKNVLPNEWIPSWDMEALKAGAMAAKTYAWYWTIHEKYPGQGYDVRDTTGDQVYVPGSSHPRTDAAVDATWHWVMTKGGAVFQAQYDSGTPGSPDPLIHGRLSQWGTQYWAQAGQDWMWILDYYYKPLEIDVLVPFIPVDLVLVLDRSGSMSGAPMQGAKNAAIAVVDMLMRQDRVAVVSFASTANTNVQLTSDFGHAKTEIQKITAGGMTSFGAGLREAVGELKERGTEGHVPIIIFMSDGHHNTSPAPDQWVNECVERGIRIYTIGFGSSPSAVDETRLKGMAAATGGQYLFAPTIYDMEKVFLMFSLEATGWPLIGEFIGTVAQGETVVAGDFTVEPDTDYVRVTLNWPGSDLDLIIERPDGTEVDLGTGTDNIYSGDDAKPEWVILIDPEPGTWIVKVFGKVINPHSEYIVWISGYVPPGPPVSPSTYKFEYSIPDPITVATDVDIDVTFMTAEEKAVGYDGVRFRFEADGPGDVTFRATDSEGVEHTFLNNGFWGPSAGFDLPALYEATTTWTLNFLHRAGDYTITFSLVEAPDGDVIADITETVTVTVKPLPAEVSIDPDTLNLRAWGQWITAYIELPEGYAADDVDIETVELAYGGQESLIAAWGDVQDGVLMAKFDWATVTAWFEGLHDVDVELTVAGEVDGVGFEGTDIIRVIDPSQRRGGR